MVFLIGLNFSDRLLVTKALTSLYGISMTSTASAVRAPSHYPANRAATATASSSKTEPNRTNTNASASQSSTYAPPPPSSARHSLLSRLMAKHHIHPTATMGSLSDATVQALSQSLSELTLENDLRRKMREDIARLVSTGTYRGNRHVRGLPVRGQRTRTQIATARKLNRVERKG